MTVLVCYTILGTINIWGQISLCYTELPRWHSGKESACQCRMMQRCKLDSWVGKIPSRRKWQPTPVFLLGDPMDRGAWQTTVHGIAKSWTQLSD